MTPAASASAPWTACLKAKVPTAASSIDNTWRDRTFVPDGTWWSGQAGVGYDTRFASASAVGFLAADTSLSDGGHASA